MSNMRSLPKIKMPLRKQLSNKTILTIGIIVISILLISFARWDTIQSSYKINDVLVSYFNAMNRQEFKDLDKYLYPTDNKEYILTIAAKANTVNLQSIRLQKIYPPLVSGSLAIVGFDSSTNVRYKGEDMTLQETDVFFLRRKGQSWYIAKPEDLEPYSATFITNMIDQYGETLRENMTEAGLQSFYNSASYKKFKGGQ